MRYIIIPPPVEVDAIVNADGSFGKVSFSEFVRHTVIPFKAWRQDDSWACSGCEVGDAVHKKAPGDLITLTDEDWERLKQVCATMDMPQVFAPYFMRFVKVITGATKNPPPTVQAAAEPVDAAAAA